MSHSYLKSFKLLLTALVFCFLMVQIVTRILPIIGNVPSAAPASIPSDAAAAGTPQAEPSPSPAQEGSRLQSPGLRPPAKLHEAPPLR